MQGSKDQFYQTAPSRILERAAKYSTNLRLYHDLPHAASKSMAVNQEAKYQKEDIEYAIEHSKFQLDLYRKKEQDDLKARLHYEQKLKDAAEKVEKNEVQILKKKEKKADEYNKHLDQTYKRYEDEEKKNRAREKEEAYKLRKQIQEFYDKQAQLKKQAEFKQIHVETEYQKAVDRINRIHERNQQYSFRAERDLNKELNRNSHFNERLSTKRRAVSELNNEKIKVYEKSEDILEDKQRHFIQTYGRNEDGSLKAWKHIDQDCQKTQKRLSEFFKKRVEKWANEKKRIDVANAETPQKCLSILDKTSRSAFRKTVSTFYNSFVDHEKTVRKNKSLIRERDERRKDELMDVHLDLRLKNDSTYKVNEKMQAMKQHAKKIADCYL